MNKTALKNFAVRARRKLIEDVTHKAYELGISKDKVMTSATLDGGSIITEHENGQVIGKRETEHRAKLIDEIRTKGFKQVMEEVAYTWFNRLIALRFMEVNDYLPTGVRVLSSLQDGKKEPDIIQQALTIDLGLDKNVIYELQDNGNATKLYKYLLIKQCNQLGKIMPGVFEPIADYTELLLPDNLLGEGAIIRDLVDSIEEYSWKIELSGNEIELEADKGDHGIEIIGWLYQYYISEKKDEVFAGLKKNIKITKENIPAATQLFTPKWIVKYMIENSLGRLWLESHPNPELQANWKYYLEEAEQETEVQKQLDELKNPSLKPEEIKVLDPAMGSGHILVYAFDVLHDIYLSAGYAEKDVPSLILEKNLYGLEIDDRAGQMASFALYMKARGRNKKLFSNMPALNLCSIQESNGIPKEAVEYLVDPQESDIEKYMHREEAEYLVDVFHDAKEYGSILDVKAIDYDALEQRVEQIKNEPPADIMEMQYKDVILEKYAPLVKQGRIMSMKYDVVCTNPPYMGSRSMNDKLLKFVRKMYPNAKADYFAIFMEKCKYYTVMNGLYSMITQPSWLFLSNFSQLREIIIKKQLIHSMLHMGRGIFGVDFGSTAFLIRNTFQADYIGIYLRLHQRVFQYIAQEDIENLYLSAIINSDFKFDFSSYENTCIEKEAIDFSNKEKSKMQIYFTVKQSSFKSIPGSPIAYWISDQVRLIFKNSKQIKGLGEPRQGLATTDNNQYIRAWHEVNKYKIGFGCKCRDSAKKSKCKWFPYNKGGEYKKWYGNNEYIVNWEDDGFDIKENVKEKYKNTSYAKGFTEKKWEKLIEVWVVKNQQYYFKKGITWSFISSVSFSSRYVEAGYVFDVGGSSIFPEDKLIKYILALFCTKITLEFLKALNPTMNFQVGNISNIPVVITSDIKYLEVIDILSQQNIDTSKRDWDSFETSWDFQTHPLRTYKNNTTSISQAYQNWVIFTESQFNQLKQNEEELNRIFIDIYDLQDELTPEVEDKEITISKANRERDIRSFLSFAVGCSFGRYSLDQSGLIFAGGDFSDKFRNSNNWELNTENGWIKSSIAIDRDNIIPFVDDDYFENDIVKKVVDFVEASFGEETLEENLTYIAETLGSKAGETPRQTIRRYFIKDYYKDHVRTYKKRPIYWLFDSGKENGFKALIYMHRYDPLTVARVRTDYLHKLQKNYEAVINQLDAVINSTAAEREKVAAKKRKEKIRKQLEECRIYDQAIAHVANQRIEIDLDDGVKVNYAKFQEVEIPQGEGRKPLKADLLAKI